jgi:nucleotide-binding universal stress UspA family protein
MYQRIVVPLDGSPTSVKGLEEAIKLAKLTHGRLRLLNIVDEYRVAVGFETYPVFNGDLLQRMVEGGHEILDQALSRAAAEGVPADKLLIESMTGRISEEIVEQATSWDADLIILGTHGRRGVGRVLLGSDAEQVVRISPVPVLLVRGDDRKGTP